MKSFFCSALKECVNRGWFSIEGETTQIPPSVSLWDYSLKASAKLEFRGSGRLTERDAYIVNEDPEEEECSLDLQSLRLTSDHKLFVYRRLRDKSLIMISDGEAINKNTNRILKQILGRDTIVFDIKYENVSFPTFCG